MQPRRRPFARTSSGSVRLSVTKTPCRRSARARSATPRARGSRSSRSRKWVVSAARARRTSARALGGGEGRRVGGRVLEPRQRDERRAEGRARRRLAQEGHRDVRDRAVVLHPREVGRGVAGEEHGAGRAARSAAAAPAAWRGRGGRRSCSRSRAGSRGSPARPRSRGAPTPRSSIARTLSRAGRRQRPRTAGSRSAGRSGRSRRRRRRASGRRRASRAARRTRARRPSSCRRRGPGRGRSGRAPPAGTAARSRPRARAR